jgi:hypothetical protein
VCFKILPGIWRDSLRDQGKNVSLLVVLHAYDPESLGSTSTWNLM